MKNFSMNLDSEIIVVSGLPRSGTSLLMQMLDAGGIEVLTDRVRSADIDNPRGYFEFERAKQIAHDAAWLADARGKAFKMVSQLLYDLPATQRYRIIFMRRNLDEMLISQEKMLRRRGESVVPRERMKEAYMLHLAKLFEWLPRQPNMKMLSISYNDLLDDPQTHAQQVSDFLDSRASVNAMTSAVDPRLYRNRNAPPTIAEPS